MYDRMKELTSGLDEQVASLFQQGQLTDFLQTMNQLTSDSLNNILLIHRQRLYSTHPFSSALLRHKNNDVSPPGC